MPPTEHIERQLRQIKWLLAGILTCLVIGLFSIPVTARLAWGVVSFAILVIVVAAAAYAVWWLGSDTWRQLRYTIKDGTFRRR